MEEEYNPDEIFALLDFNSQMTVGDVERFKSQMEELTHDILFNRELPKDIWFQIYREYLRTNQWKQVRAIVLKKYNNSCAECGISHKKLQIHHLTYIHWGRPGEENDCIVLCKKCHKKRHSPKKTELI